MGLFPSNVLMVRKQAVVTAYYRKTAENQAVSAFFE